MSAVLRVVSVSGGKDSTALYCWAYQQWRDDFLPVFADTGHEHPVTLNYVRNLHVMVNGAPKVDWVRADFSQKLAALGVEPTGSAFLDMMLWKRRAPSAKAQFCTEHVKLRPIQKWLESVRGDREVVMYTGIRAGESLRRSKMPDREWSPLFDCWTERPLLRWTESMVFNYLYEYCVDPNPLYAAGFGRVGCFPCIHATKGELARLPDWAWDKIEAWEKRVGQSWFSAGDIPGVIIPTVADGRAWSKTVRGGKQIDMFAPTAMDVPSCMSTWGACE